MINQNFLDFFQSFDGLLLFIAALLVFLWIRGGLSKDMLMLFYRITRDVRNAHRLHFILIFPGVLLHEFSHWIVLRLLGVRCSLHLGIEMQEDFVVYGHVDYYESEVNAVKHFLSGIAPLVSGLTIISLLAVNFLGIPTPTNLVTQKAAITLEPLGQAMGHWTFWVALYLLFAITSEMVPSPSDRKYWLPLGVMLILLVILSILTKTSTWFLANLYPYLNQWLKLMGVVFLIGCIPQLILWMPMQFVKLFRHQH